MRILAQSAFLRIVVLLSTATPVAISGTHATSWIDEDWSGLRFTERREG